jgi:putative ABC transport system permease protein
MHLMQGVVIALKELWAHKLRTFLTLLGNIVGVMSIIAIVSIIEGANSYIEGKMSGAGSGLFQVRQTNELNIISNIDLYLKSMHNPRVTLSDMTYLQDRLTLAEYLDGSISSSVEVRHLRFKVKSVSLRGRTEIYPLLEDYHLKDGRHFVSYEVTHSRNVAVLGCDVAEQLYSSADPIGQEIRIAGYPFRIIGVLDRLPRGMFSNPNLMVIIPVTTFGKAFGSTRSLSISIKPRNLSQASECMEQARLAMRVRRHLRPKQEDNFGIVAEESLLDLWKSVSSQIGAVLVGIVSISIIVSGIVIMNIMLMSVTERTWEIGIRKAMGATSNNILWQFLVESTTLSMVGGFVGIVAGFIVAALIAYFSPLPYAIKLWSIVIGLLVTFVVGIFFGAYPATKAARLDPIEALRYE